MMDNTDRRFTFSLKEAGNFVICKLQNETPHSQNTKLFINISATYSIKNAFDMTIASKKRQSISFIVPIPLRIF
jgi:hypothetical protein